MYSVRISLSVFSVLSFVCFGVVVGLLMILGVELVRGFDPWRVMSAVLVWVVIFVCIIFFFIAFVDGFHGGCVVHCVMCWFFAWRE